VVCLECYKQGMRHSAVFGLRMFIIRTLRRHTRNSLTRFLDTMTVEIFNQTLSSYLFAAVEPHQFSAHFLFTLVLPCLLLHPCLQSECTYSLCIYFHYIFFSNIICSMFFYTVLLALSFFLSPFIISPSRNFLSSLSTLFSFHFFISVPFTFFSNMFHSLRSSHLPLLDFFFTTILSFSLLVYMLFSLSVSFNVSLLLYSTLFPILHFSFLFSSYLSFFLFTFFAIITVVIFNNTVFKKKPMYIHDEWMDGTKSERNDTVREGDK
jgi:hypothetical protein